MSHADDYHAEFDEQVEGSVKRLHDEIYDQYTDAAMNFDVLFGKGLNLVPVDGKLRVKQAELVPPNLSCFIRPDEEGEYIPARLYYGFKRQHLRRKIVTAVIDNFRQWIGYWERENPGVNVA